MKILFLHTNFPGQFKHICKHFAELKHDVRFICQTNYGRNIKRVQCFKLKKNSNEETQSTISTSEQYRQAFIKFDEDGWIPDLVISHSGWGCGLNVKEIWPDTKFISYLEWWFNPKSATYSYDPENENLGLNSHSIPKHWLRNKDISLELASADKIVAPSFWQKKQLPQVFQANCQVIFDGIDLEQFRPKINTTIPFQHLPMAQEVWNQ